MTIRRLDSTMCCSQEVEIWAGEWGLKKFRVLDQGISEAFATIARGSS